MDISSRRHFVKTGVSLAAISALPTAVFATMGPNDKFDLLIRNSNVL